MGTTLTVTAKGQVTLRKEVLRHLGVAPGQKVEMSLLPNGRLEVRAADWPAIEARLAMLAAGGDFADGAIAFEGRRRGGEVFASFDRTAIRLIAETGGVTHLLSGSSRSRLGKLGHVHGGADVRR